MKKLGTFITILCMGVVALANPSITDVTAQQRYPWNGKVDIRFTVTGADDTGKALIVQAVDRETGITNMAVNVTGDTTYSDGAHHVVWDMTADDLNLVSTNVVFCVAYAMCKYCIIDLSGGTSASSYPVSYLDDVPSGGWTDAYKTTKLVLRRITAGTLTMGERSTDYPNASSYGLHQVTLTKDYWMGVFQVTQRQWELVMGTRPSYFSNSSCYQARPVEQVSYNAIRGSLAGAGWPNSSAVDATSFLGVLRAKTGLTGLDLPTEAQWEYACRAGTMTALNNGKNLTSTESDSAMNEVGRYYYNGGSSSSSSVDTSGATAKVGSYKANAWGLYDMHGNVYEWCLDWYGAYSGDATDPNGVTSGSDRVLRGGSWDYGAYSCRSAYRSYFNPSCGSRRLGFRLYCSAVLSSSSASVDCLSDPTTIDLTDGTRTANKTEQICFSPVWETDADGAVATISVNGVVVTNATDEGTYAWHPTRDGTYTLTHVVQTNGVQVGEALTATFVAEGFNPKAPVITPVGGTTFDTASLSVSISCASEGATIHYTTNGITPTLESPVYKRFKIYGKTTVKAIAFYKDGTPSEMAVAEYARGTCTDPVITPVDGTTFLHKDQEVSITMGEEGTIHYTLDGSEPTLDSPVYEGPFTISDSTVVKAKVFSDKFFDSQVVTVNLTRAREQVTTPVITAAAHFTGSKTTVSITCTTPGATIRYTTNGNDPSSHSTTYKDPFDVTASCTIKVYAVLDDYTNSEIAAWSIEKIWGIGDSLGAPDRIFTASGDAAWYDTADATALQGSSLCSGVITNNQETVFSTVIPDAGEVSFKWKTSCEQDPEGKFEWDHAEFWVDGSIVTNLDGVTDWETVTCTVSGAYSHTLTWKYVKDDVEGEGEDCAWVSDFVWTYADTLPNLGDSPRRVEVEEVLADVTDERLMQYVCSGEEYVAYRTWATNVQSTAGGLSGTQAVQDSKQAWLSYALDSAVLLANAPTNGQMKVAAFEKSAETGLFDFTVGIEGVTVGAQATAENLATLLGVEGCASVDGTYTSDSLSFTFGTPIDGKVTISAKPVDTEATQFFLKVKMTP